MTPSLAIFFVIVVSFIAVLATIFSVMTLIRLNNVEQNLEKVALLLTVLANKQGATQEDIKKATAS